MISKILIILLKLILILGLSIIGVLGLFLTVCGVVAPDHHLISWDVLFIALGLAIIFLVFTAIVKIILL